MGRRSKTARKDGARADDMSAAARLSPRTNTAVPCSSSEQAPWFLRLVSTFRRGGPIGWERMACICAKERQKMVLSTIRQRCPAMQASVGGPVFRCRHSLAKPGPPSQCDADPAPPLERVDVCRPRQLLSRLRLCHGRPAAGRHVATETSPPLRAGRSHVRRRLRRSPDPTPAQLRFNGGSHESFDDQSADQRTQVRQGRLELDAVPLHAPLGAPTTPAPSASSRAMRARRRGTVQSRKLRTFSGSTSACG